LGPCTAERTKGREGGREGGKEKGREEGREEGRREKGEREKWRRAGCQWLTPVIPATQETELRKIIV
jgi:flagellar biosynthesis/type III secretory pathway protein FliH